MVDFHGESWVVSGCEVVGTVRTGGSRFRGLGWGSARRPVRQSVRHEGRVVKGGGDFEPVEGRE